MARMGDTARTSLKSILEGVLMASDEPLKLGDLAAIFTDDEKPSNADINNALHELQEDYSERGIELKEVASGFRIQVREDVNLWVSRLWEERPQRYSRALLETLSLIAYRQPITRGDIEEVRGVSVRSTIIRTLQEREWIRVVGHRDVPGKPALFGTTKAFLDYFNLASLDDLPSLAEIADMENLEPELDLEPSEAKEGEDSGEAEPVPDSGEAEPVVDEPSEPDPEPEQGDPAEELAEPPQAEPSADDEEPRL